MLLIKHFILSQIKLVFGSKLFRMCFQVIFIAEETILEKIIIYFPFKNYSRAKASFQNPSSLSASRFNK
jgi:hypothetical protein